MLKSSCYYTPPQDTLLDHIAQQLQELLKVYSNLVEKEINDQELTPERVLKVQDMEPDLCAHCSQFSDD